MKNYLRLFLALLPSLAHCADWPSWRGPTQDNASSETDWTDQWPGGQPKEIWRADVQLGFGSMVVGDGRLFTLGHNGENTATLFCIDAASGKSLWKKSWDSNLGDKYFEGGPVSTPVLDGPRLYLLTRWGQARCLQAATGKTLWQRDLVETEDVRVPTWGFAGAPVIHGERLLLNVGEAGMALSKATGKVLWKSARRSAGYSSPVVFEADSNKYALFSSDKQYTAVDLATGKPWWSYRWLTRYGVNATDPVVTDDAHALISTGYGKGSALIKMYKDDPETLWKSRELKTQMSTSLLIDGHLYGVDGDTTQKASLKCVELKTGKLKWSHREFGSGNVLTANGKLICLSGAGELIVAPVSSSAFQPTARAKVLDGKCWNPHILANGRLYCRNAEGDLVCLDLSK